MRKAKLQAATLGGNPDDIEAAFYDALRQGRHRAFDGVLGR